MPIYEYQCQACGHVLDALQKVGDAPLKKCPDCGKPKLKRLLSAPMFLLKGTGWYETDFKSDKERRKNLADRAEPDKKEEVAGAKADEAATPAKPEDKKAEKKDGAGESKAGVAAPSGGTRKPAARKHKARPAGRRPRA